MSSAERPALLADDIHRIGSIVLQEPSLATVGVIAERLKRPLHRIEYIIRSRAIEPIGVAGNARVFSEATIAHIESELRRIETAKEQPKW